MMDWDFGAAVLAGLVATGAMTILMYMGRIMMPEKMPMNILHMEGTMVAPGLTGCWTADRTARVGEGSPTGSDGIDAAGN